MRSKENCQSDIVSAWAMASLQAMKECPEGEIEEIERMSVTIMEELMSGENGVPLSPDEFVDIYDVPQTAFLLVEMDVFLVDLHLRIKTLNTDYQKLLHYIVQGHDSKIICESMGYDEETYWIKRTDCIAKFLKEGADLTKKDTEGLLKVYDLYAKIRDNFLYNTDVMSNSRKKRKTRLKWIITTSVSILVPLVFFLFIYPKIIQKDFNTLFDYGIEKSNYTMTIDSVDLLNEMILETELYTPENHWLMALQAIQSENSKECRNQLKALKDGDIEMFNERGRYVYRRLKR